MSISSCATTDSRLSLAATTQGKIKAGVSLPDQPADCRVQEPHAEVTAGDEARSVLIRERGALDRANARVGRCSEFEDTVRTKFNR